MKLLLYIVCFLFFSLVTLSQDLNERESKRIITDELLFSYGIAFSENGVDGSISAFNTCLSGYLLDLLPTHALNRLILELHISNYIPLSNRATSALKNTTQYGLGLSYLFQLPNKREVMLGFSPFISHNFFRYVKNETSYLALQFEAKIPILLPSETSRSLYMGLAYTTTPLVYTKIESKYDFLRFFMTFGF